MATKPPRIRLWNRCSAMVMLPAKSYMFPLIKRLHENPVGLRAASWIFRTLQKLGVSVTPNHFYWPVPDLMQLEGRPWPGYRPMFGIDLRLDEQVEFLHSVISKFRHEWCFARPPNHSDQFHYNNGYFEAVDAEVAYSIVRHVKPRRIVEVGSGYSTKVMAAALSHNAEYDNVEGKLVTIDPSPRYSSLGSRVTLVPERVQEVDRRIFESLEGDDILFLDSSHVVSVGSDTVVEYLEILPQLSKGVLIHAHDIFLPYDYPRKLVLENLSFWSEQYLLQAFISFNQSFQVLWSSSAMHSCRRELLESMFPQWEGSYRNLGPKQRRFVPSLDGERVWPSSFWMRRVQ